MASVEMRGIHHGYNEPWISSRTALANSEGTGPSLPAPFEYQQINEIGKTDYRENRVRARGFTGQIIDIWV